MEMKEQKTQEQTLTFRTLHYSYTVPNQGHYKSELLAHPLQHWKHLRSNDYNSACLDESSTVGAVKLAQGTIKPVPPIPVSEYIIQELLCEDPDKPLHLPDADKDFSTQDEFRLSEALKKLIDMDHKDIIRTYKQDWTCHDFAQMLICERMLKTMSWPRLAVRYMRLDNLLIPNLSVTFTRPIEKEMHKFSWEEEEYYSAVRLATSLSKEHNVMLNFLDVDNYEEPLLIRIKQLISTNPPYVTPTLFSMRKNYYDPHHLVVNLDVRDHSEAECFLLNF